MLCRINLKVQHGLYVVVLTLATSWLPLFYHHHVQCSLLSYIVYDHL